MRRIIAKTLKRFGLLDFDLLSKAVDSFPGAGQVASGDLVHVVDGGIEKWACLLCPGGCGAAIPLSLNKQRRPRWTVRFDWFQRPSIEPSVHQLNACGCHFWVRGGRIEWCKDGMPPGMVDGLPTRPGSPR
ncbi:DUF6527 family protein [Aureimonas ureilytica]|uniref:DUF6527 family protein n=1 Tax=Aureimonas ureilytica TaxID=401562 RepID=UPI0003737A4D|nr:DUF6527 family protein [Aureimonas ureilytica]